jgi:hypothetical protein
MLPSLYASGRVLPIITRGAWKAAVARLGAVVLLAAGLTVVTSGASQAGVLHCGDVITANTRLGGDLVKRHVRTFTSRAGRINIQVDRALGNTRERAAGYLR